MSINKQYFNKILSYLSSNRKELLYSIIITLIFFGSFYRMNYTTDTYADIMGNYANISSNFLGAGRFFAYALYMLYKIGISINYVYLVSFTLAILSISASIFILGGYLQSIVKSKKTLPYLLATLLVINPFTIELLFYLEKGIMTSAILFAILGAISFHKYTKKQQKAQLFISFLFAFLCCCSYQGIIGLYITLSATFMLLDNNRTKIKSFILCTLIYLAAIIANILIAKLINGSTKSSVANLDILESIKALTSGSIRMVALYNIIPAIIVYLLLAFTIISFICNTNTKNKTSYIELLVIIILIIGSSILPYLSQSPNNIWFVPRSSWPFAAGISIILIYIYGQKSVKAKTLNIAKASCCIMLLLEFLSFNQIIIDHYQTNAIDKEVISQIGEKISEFEKSNNTKITNVSIIHDDSIIYTYPQKRAIGDAQVMAMATSWSDVNSLNYYTGRNLTPTRISNLDNVDCSNNNNIQLDVIFPTKDIVVICKH